MKIEVGDKVTRRVIGEVIAVSEVLDYVTVRFEPGDTATYSTRHFRKNFQSAETPVQRKTENPNAK